MTKFEATRAQYKSVVTRLREVLREQKSDIVRDSAILRFELALDLGWKSIKAYLESQHGVLCASPKSCFREAFKVGLIEYEERWLKLVDLRNQTMRTYDESVAEAIFAELPEALQLFNSLPVALERE